LQKLAREAEVARKAEAERANLQVMIEHVEMFAQRVRAGLHDADWQTRREILRALLNQVAESEDGIRIVYKVQPCPFEAGPSGGPSQRCWRRDHRALRRAYLRLRALTILGHPRPEPFLDQAEVFVA
jgi:hypothetical protein